MHTLAAKNDAETQRERDNRDAAYRAALEAIVLLENDGALPLKPGRIALYGSGGRRTIKGGTGSGEVNERHSISISEGLEKSGFTITTQSWLDDYDEQFLEGLENYKTGVRKKMKLLNPAAIISIMANPYRHPYGRIITDDDVKQSDTDACVYVIARQAGEGADRKLDNNDTSVSEIELRNLKICAESYRKTILVINVGSSFDVSFLDNIPGINALIHFGQQGTMGGLAFAEIVSGKNSPSGKLTDTWAASYDDVPFSREYSYLNGDLENEYYKEGIYVGYRYFDSFEKAPAYEFGYGLSYTEFEIRPVKISIDKTLVSVEVSIENSGKKHGGKEVVQLYISSPQSALPKEYQRLAAFGKTVQLAPGESTELKLTVDLASQASFDEKRAAFILDAGDYVLRLGNSSRNTAPCALIHLDERVELSRHRNLCKPQQAVNELTPAAVEYKDDVKNVLRLSVKAGDFETIVHSYDAPPGDADMGEGSLVNTLNSDEFIELSVGSGMGSVLFGRNHFTCPGAVGNTTSALVEKGIINATFADGPAGLRLQRRSALKRNGRIKMIDAQIEMMEYLPGFFKRIIFGNEQKDELLYQYTTAFPVELSLAQTWNTSLLEEMGRAISREMTEYGVTFWLGPGLNIHRNPLCGRNFEYYSEDPLLSGRMAAAVTRGCQSTDGNYATLKHFVANNQEENRNWVSSNVNERALREIYLRGFEIAVKEGGAKAVMTSYNRVNGVYAPNSHDLCTRILRNEWGFEGVVMTDWVATGKGRADDAQCIKAGNNLIMPGGKSAKRRIKKALKKGILTEEILRRSAMQILKAVLCSGLARKYPATAGENAG